MGTIGQVGKIAGGGIIVKSFLILQSQQALDD